MFFARSEKALLTIVSALVLVFALATTADAQTFTGSFGTDTWSRPDANCASDVSYRRVDTIVTFPSATGSYTFTATRSGGATVAIDVWSQENLGWCSDRRAYGTSGAGTASVTYNVQNTEYPLVLVVSAGTTTDTGSYTVTVSNAPAGAGVESYCDGTGALSPSSQSVAIGGASGLTTTYSPPAGVECSGYRTMGVPAWISGFPAWTGGGRTFTYAVQSNPGGPRTANIRIGERTLVVNQAGTCTYSLSPSSMTVGGAGGVRGFGLNVSSGCAWTATTNTPWISITDTSGSGPASVRFVAAENTGSARSGTISVGGKTFTVNQNAACTYAVGPGTLDLDQHSSTEEVTVTTQFECPRTGVDNADWITQIATGGGSGTSRFTVSGNSGPARTSTVTFGDASVTVNQASGCVVSLPIASRTVPAAGQSSSFTVSTGTGCAFDVASDVPWLSGTPASGKVDFVVESSTVLSRVGTLTVTDTSTSSSAMYTITQASGCVPTIATGGESLSAAAFDGTFAVATEAGCSFDVTEDVDWLTTSATAGGVEFSVLANEGPERVGTITVAGAAGEASYAVTQASGCTIAVSDTEVELAADGSSAVALELTTGAGCSVVASSSDDWLHFDEIFGEVFGPRNDGATRTGTVTLTSGDTTLTVTVTQPSTLPLPSIGQGPRSEKVRVGDDLTLLVDATGAGLTYQWRKDGVVIPYETSATLELVRITLEDAGSYDVVVSNLAGSVVSDAAVVTVEERASGCAASSNGGSAWPLALALVFMIRRRPSMRARRM